MRDAGKLKICRLKNNSEPGLRPVEALELICEAYYSEMTVGVTRAYAAMSANQQIDMLVRCYKTSLPADAEYVVTEAGDQFRISLKQNRNDDVDLTLERLENYYDVNPGQVTGTQGGAGNGQ